MCGLRDDWNGEGLGGHSPRNRLLGSELYDRRTGPDQDRSTSDPAQTVQ